MPSRQNSRKNLHAVILKVDPESSRFQAALSTGEAEKGPIRLDQYLSALLQWPVGVALSKSKIRKLIMVGSVYLGGRRVSRANQVIVRGEEIKVWIDPEKLADRVSDEDPTFRLQDSDILFEDEWLIVVSKPPYLPTQPTVDENRINLFAALKLFVQNRELARGSQAEPYVGLHHRLDRDTSGVVLFTKSKSVNAAVGELFSKHLAQKKYLAIVEKRNLQPLKSCDWIVKNYLARRGRSAQMAEVKSGGDYAETQFIVLSESSKTALIQAIPKTGRTHQIRVHLAGYGLPIASDDLYGDYLAHSSRKEGQLAPRLMLHAESLEFKHPVHGQSILVKAPTPTDFVETLRRLGLG